MKNITPTQFRCSIGGCPAVLEITPEALRCEIAASCRAIFEAAGDLVIIGKIPSAAIMDQIEGRVGPGETAIVIDRALLSELITAQAQEGLHLAVKFLSDPRHGTIEQDDPELHGQRDDLLAALQGLVTK